MVEELGNETPLLLTCYKNQARIKLNINSIF